jgi:hypothetical protein
LATLKSLLLKGKPVDEIKYTSEAGVGQEATLFRVHFNSGANLPESYGGATSRYLGNYRASFAAGLTGLRAFGKMHPGAKVRPLDALHFILGAAYLPESLKRVEHTEKLARYASNVCKSRLSKLSGRCAPELK